jgi:hypothetical protein
MRRGEYPNRVTTHGSKAAPWTARLVRFITVLTTARHRPVYQSAQCSTTLMPRVMRVFAYGNRANAT